MSIEYAVTALSNLIKLVIGRGRTLSLNDSGSVQVIQIQLSAKEIYNLLRLSEYGFASRPLPGSDNIAVFISGDRSNGVIIATGDQRYRLKLENDGEVALYDNMGRYVWFKKDGGLVLHDPAKITLDAPLVECTGDFSAPDGNVSDSVRSMAEDRGKYDSHGHTLVQTGTDTSGPPTIIE